MGHGQPLPSLTWSKNGTVVSNNSRNIIDEEQVTEKEIAFVKSKLEICSADLSDSGLYTCFADNGRTNDTISFELTVVTPQGK